MTISNGKTFRTHLPVVANKIERMAVILTAVWTSVRPPVAVYVKHASVVLHESLHPPMVAWNSYPLLFLCMHAYKYKSRPTSVSMFCNISVTLKWWATMLLKDQISCNVHDWLHLRRLTARRPGTLTNIPIVRFPLGAVTKWNLE